MLLSNCAACGLQEAPSWLPCATRGRHSSLFRLLKVMEALGLAEPAAGMADIAHARWPGDAAFAQRPGRELGDQGAFGWLALRGPA